jgi:hypothetical protein
MRKITEPYCAALKRGFFLPLMLAGLLAGVLAGPLPQAEPREAGLDPERLARVHELVRGQVEEGEHAGAILLIARHGKLVDWQARPELGRADGKGDHLPDLFDDQGGGIGGGAATLRAGEIEVGWAGDRMAAGVEQLAGLHWRNPRGDAARAGQQRDHLENAAQSHWRIHL